MKKISIQNFNSYYKYKAIFFNQENIIVHANQYIPFINFKEGLDYFATKIQEVFLQQNILFVQLNNSNIDDKFDIYSTKFFLRYMNEDHIHLVIKSVQWLTWHANHRYCSKCGNKIDIIYDTVEKKCHNCCSSYFPSLSPAIMVLLHKEDKILLARSAHFAIGMYSVLAGFVDIGESAEDAVHREVAEEVGLKLHTLKYFGSQSWPFPSSFMIAFNAEYLSGEINIDSKEIEDAQWFHINNLPKLPPKSSISRKLIDFTVKKLF